MTQDTFEIMHKLFSPTSPLPKYFTGLIQFFHSDLSRSELENTLRILCTDRNDELADSYGEIEDSENFAYLRAKYIFESTKSIISLYFAEQTLISVEFESFDAVSEVNLFRIEFFKKFDNFYLQLHSSELASCRLNPQEYTCITWIADCLELREELQKESAFTSQHALVSV